MATLRYTPKRYISQGAYREESRQVHLLDMYRILYVYCTFVCVCVSTCVVLCAIRSTVKQEVSTGQDRKKETRDDREPCGFSSSFAPSPPVSLFSTLANPWQCLPPQPPKRKVKKKLVRMVEGRREKGKVKKRVSDVM